MYEFVLEISRLSSSSFLHRVSTPGFFSTFPTPVMCRAVSTVTAYACVRGCVFGRQESVLRWWLATCVFRLASASYGVHPETRGHVGTRLQIPASIMTPGSVNVRSTFGESTIICYFGVPSPPSRQVSSADETRSEFNLLQRLNCCLLNRICDI